MLLYSYVKIIDVETEVFLEEISIKWYAIQLDFSISSVSVWSGMHICMKSVTIMKSAYFNHNHNHNHNHEIDAFLYVIVIILRHPLLWSEEARIFNASSSLASR